MTRDELTAAAGAIDRLMSDRIPVYRVLVGPVPDWDAPGPVDRSIIKEQARFLICYIPKPPDTPEENKE